MISPATLQLLVSAVELAQEFGPGLLHAGEALITSIQNHGNLTDAQKADLVERVKAAGNYTPREGV